MMIRVMLYDRFGQFQGELAEGDVFALTRFEEVNGEHSLEITTTKVLEQGWRVVTQDARGKWREHVVYGTDALHGSGERPMGTYYCVWSIQPDMMGARVSRMPGIETPVSAQVALGFAIEGTARWQVGTVTNLATGGASMYDTDCWDALATLIANWGGELDVTVEMSDEGVTARKVDLYDAQGEHEAKRRFDFGADLKSVRRRVADGPLYCRITPRGKGDETDQGGYGRKITIESVNDGKDYLEYAPMVDVAKLPNGSGGWEYPTLEVENSECDTPEELKAWAEGILEEKTVPRITYEIDTLQLAEEGVDMRGVSLGDAVQVVDGKFGDGLRVSGRVASMKVNMLDETDTKLVIGYVGGGLDELFGILDARVSALANTVQQMNGGTFSTAEYLSRLLARLNAEINEAGGYTYITEGQGIRTYNTAVSDPLVGAEATAVTEIKGGTIRIANSKTAQGEWQWKTVFTSGHIAADMVTTAQLTAGYIGGVSGNNFWNLDTGNFSLRDNSSGYGITKTNGTLTIDGSVVNVDRLYPKEIISPDGTYGLAFRDSSHWSQVGDSLVLLANPNGSSPVELMHFDVQEEQTPGSYSPSLRLKDSYGNRVWLGTTGTADNVALSLYYSNGARTEVQDRLISMDAPNGVHATLLLDAAVGLAISCRDDNNNSSWIHLKPGADPRMGH